MLRRRYSEGFALPTVIITSVVMFAILVAATGTVSSTGDAINTQFYEALATDAAESGMNHAKSCLMDNNQASTWGSNELHPNTGCNGGPPCSDKDSCYVVRTDTYNSTYSVSPVTDSGSGFQTVTVKSTLTLTRASTGAAWRTFSKTLKVRTGAQVSANQVIFGYIGQGTGAFFATVGGDGVMRATGYNGFGQLGNGTFNPTLVPKKFLAPTSAPIVAGYTSFLSLGTSMFAVDSNGEAYAAGSNHYGQLGTGSGFHNISSPARVSLPLGKQVRHISVRGGTTYFLTTDNNLYAAGNCEGGALGTTYTISGCLNQSIPVRVSLPIPDPSDPNTIPTDNLVADRTTTYIRMAGGRVYGWGSNDHGQLGDVSFADRSSPVKIGTYGDSGQPKATKIAFDGLTLYVLDSAGALKSMGSNSNGQAGTGVMSLRVNTTNFCLDTDGSSAHIWNCNESASQKFQLRSDGSFYNASKNVCLTTVGSNGLKMAACDGSAAQKFRWEPETTAMRGYLKHASSGLCVNNRDYNVAGGAMDLEPCAYYANRIFYPVNASLQQFDNSVFSGVVVDVVSDQWAVAVLTSNGEVWGAGVNTSGHLGNGSQSVTQFKPVKFAMPVAAKYIYITNNDTTNQYSYQNLFAVGADGRVYGAGSNSYGQLGNGSTAPAVTTPVAMNVIDGSAVSARSVQVGLGTTVIFTTDGSVYSVGNNSHGQLGDGTMNNSSTPIRAKYLNDFSATSY
jgi:regulator of chromosome condensation RCC1